MAVNYAAPFSVGAGASLSIDNATHGMGHKNLRVQLWDNGSPRRRFRAGPVSIHPTTFLISIPFLQAQSGLVVVQGAQAAPGLQGNRLFAFAASTTWTLPASTHGFVTDHLIIDVYDDSTPRIWLPDADVTLSATGDITVTWLQAQAGAMVVSAYADVGTANSGTALTGALTQTILGSTHGRGTAALGVQCYDAAGVEVVPGIVTVHPSTYDVTLGFLQAPVGTVVLNGSQYVGTLTATLQGTSTTPAVATAIILHRLTAGLAGTSTTPTAVAQMAGLRQLTAGLVGTSTTPTSAVTALRRLTASLTGTSTTTTASATLGTLRQLTALLQGASATPAIARTMARGLTAALQGSSTTPASGSTQARGLSATLVGSTTTPASTVGPLARRLTASLRGTSLTPTAAAQMTGLRQLTATLAGASTTPSAQTTSLRRLTAGLVGSSATPTATGAQQMPLVASLRGTSVTPTATAIMGTLRPLTAVLRGTSTTPVALGAMTRSLTAVVLGSSATPAIAQRTVHLLTAALQGTSSTPPIAGALLRSLTSVFRGSSATADSAYLLARGLTSAFEGRSVTPATALVTVHLLTATFVGVSVIPAPLLIPFSGQMQLRALLQGSSQTTDARVRLLTPQRQGTVAPGGRHAVVPAVGTGSRGTRVLPERALVETT